MTLLGDVAELNPRFSGSLLGDAELSYLGMADVSEEGTTSAGTLRSFEEVKKGYTPFNNGDLLVAKITPCFENGKIAQAAIGTPQGFGSTEFHVVRVDSTRVDARYLLHYLRSPSVRRVGEQRMTGSAGQKRVPKAFLESLDVPLPPLPEQRRIASILDQADALRAKRRRMVAILEGLADSEFVHSFLGAEAIESRELGEVTVTTSGGTPSRSVSAYFSGDIPWVKSGEVAQGIVLRTDEAITREGLESSSAKLMPVGTVLVAMYGATAGEVGQLGIEAATNQAVCCIQPGDKFTTAFLVAALRSKRGELKSMAVGGAQPNLSLAQLRSVRVPMPPIELQQAFEDKTRGFDSLRMLAKSHLTKLDELFASLQYRAFAGEL